MAFWSLTDQVYCENGQNKKSLVMYKKLNTLYTGFPVRKMSPSLKIIVFLPLKEWEKRRRSGES